MVFTREGGGRRVMIRIAQATAHTGTWASSWQLANSKTLRASFHRISQFPMFDLSTGLPRERVSLCLHERGAERNGTRCARNTNVYTILLHG
jgi:hypothetical protein